MSDQLSPQYSDDPQYIDMNHYYSSSPQYHCIGLRQNQELEESSDTSYYWTDEVSGWNGTPEHSQEPVPIIRVVKRRTTANKKERRRTQSINNAFADLRERIPNVPSDTKLSKIKTLRLATSYICYLMGVLETEDPGQGFNADLSHTPRIRHSHNHYSNMNHEERDSRKAKGRTGWPQHVWALELQHEHSPHSA